MIRYKIDIIQALKEKGFPPGLINENRLLPGQTMTNIRKGKMVSLETINKICCMLRCQPGDLIECFITDEEKIKYF